MRKTSPLLRAWHLVIPVGHGVDRRRVGHVGVLLCKRNDRCGNSRVAVVRDGVAKITPINNGVTKVIIRISVCQSNEPGGT